jgi:iron complex outermembrane receptor protein
VRKNELVASVAAALVLGATPGFAAAVPAPAASAAGAFDIPAGALGAALNQLGRAAGVVISYDAAAVQGKTTAGTRGARDPGQALDAVLRGTGLRGRPDGAGGYVVGAAPAATSARVPAANRPGQGSTPRAQDTALEEVLVTGLTAPYANTGLFGEQAVLDTPFSITAYTEELFKAKQARTLTDVIEADPSVRSNLSASSESEQYVVRGFPLFASEVAIEGLYGMLPIRRIPIEPFGKVEVFKGPNALVNGIAPFGNIGGMINLVPKRAQAQRTLNATAVYVSEGQFGGNVDLGDRFGDDRQFGVRVNAARYAGDLALDFVDRRASVASVAMDYDAGPLQLTADALLTSELIKGQDHHLTANAGFDIPKAPDSKINYGQPWTRTETDSQSFILGAGYEILPRTRITAKYGYLKFNEVYRYTLGTLTSENGDFTSRFSLFGSKSIDQTGELTLRSEFETGALSHSFVASASALYIKGFGNLPFATIPTLRNNIYSPVYIARPEAMFTDAVAAQFDDMRHSTDRKLSGIAIGDTISAYGDRVRLTLGLRRQNAKLANFDRVTGAQLTNYDEAKTTYAVALLVKPQDNWSLYANTSQGLTPGLFAPAGSANNGTVFAPFVSTQYELGSKLDLGALSASVALFRINQPFGYVQPATNMFVLDGDVINKGVELNVSGKPTAELTLLGGVLFSDAEQKGTAGGLTDGKRPIGTPQWQFNMLAEYAPQALPGFAINAAYIYTGEQFYDVENQRPIDAWNRLDLGMRYAFEVGGGRYTARANIENLTGESYWQSASRGFLTRGAPRTVRLSLEMNF